MVMVNKFDSLRDTFQSIMYMSINPGRQHVFLTLKTIFILNTTNI